MDLIDIYRTFHPKETKSKFSSNPRGSVSKTDNMAGHNISFNKFKKIEIITSIFSDHESMKLEINLKEKKRKLKTLKYMEAK